MSKPEPARNSEVAARYIKFATVRWRLLLELMLEYRQEVRCRSLNGVLDQF